MENDGYAPSPTACKAVVLLLALIPQFGTRGETRTLNPLRAAASKATAYSIPPLVLVSRTRFELVTPP